MAATENFSNVVRYPTGEPFSAANTYFSVQYETVMAPGSVQPSGPSTSQWVYKSPDTSENISSEGKAVADPTREEIDAKLAAVEARLETKLVGIDGKLDRLADQITMSSSSVTSKLETVAEQTKDARDSARQAQSAASGIKWHIIYTAIGVIAIIVAMWGIWTQGIEMVTGLVGAVPDVPAEVIQKGPTK